jgi:hypothetical protein
MKTMMLAAALLLSATTWAQKAPVKPAPKPAGTLKKVTELKMPKTAEDDMAGSRGASVAWHPLQKKYYAAFAGNAAYPFAVFDVKGKRLSDDNLACDVDVRGLWYDAEKKTICGNGYNETGWFSYSLNTQGLPTGSTIDAAGMNQPRDQCVGALDPKEKVVIFFNGSFVYEYDPVLAAGMDSIVIHWGRTFKEGAAENENPAVTPDGYNTTSIIYTGQKGAEWGFLNAGAKQIELYDTKTGFLSKTIKLPTSAVTPESFGFAYTNGIYWLFDGDNRKWVGYK